MSQGDSTAGTEKPPPLTDYETLARTVTDTKEANFAKKNIDNTEAEIRIHPGSFTQYGRSKISVDRYDRMTTQDAVAHGEELAKMRGPNRRFHGWAILTRGDVANIGYDAEESPEGGHFWHADILLPADAATDNEWHNHYANDLAGVATWLERPT